MAARVTIFPKEFERAVLQLNPVDKLLMRETKEIGEKISKDTTNSIKFEFLSHPIAQEIDAGPNAQTSFPALAGQGNLYSFLGFDDGDDPIGGIIEVIEKEGRFQSFKIRRGSYGIRIFAADEESFEGVAELPWLAGSNWVKQITRGIPGLPYYLPLDGGGRSGGAIQSTNRVRSGAVQFAVASIKEL